MSDLKRHVLGGKEQVHGGKGHKANGKERVAGGKGHKANGKEKVFCGKGHKAEPKGRKLEGKGHKDECPKLESLEFTDAISEERQGMLNQLGKRKNHAKLDLFIAYD